MKKGNAEPMPSLLHAVRRLRDRRLLPGNKIVSTRELNRLLQPVSRGSLGAIVKALDFLADRAQPVGGSINPYFRKARVKRFDASRIGNNTDHIDLTNVRLPAYGATVSDAASLFEARAAAAIRSATGKINEVSLHPSGIGDNDLLEEKKYKDKAPDIYIPRAKCLAAMAYPDYFMDAQADILRPLVSQAILASDPGWCGSFGPGVDGTFDAIDIIGPDHFEGNYDMSQMHLLPIAYRYFDLLSPRAQEWLITGLLAKGTIHRVNREDIFTSEGLPDDWDSAGYMEVVIPILDIFINIVNLKFKRIGETENHVLMINTARYLSNQLMYQRNPDPKYDNRRNRPDGGFSCTELILALLRNILRDDFSEYNAKNYQNETRYALLNLCSYAYDYEVRLAARMVLDYVSAHIAVSSNDLRRMVPFRRRGEGSHVAPPWVRSKCPLNLT
jgi:hypothetical protein